MKYAPNAGSAACSLGTSIAVSCQPRFAPDDIAAVIGLRSEIVSPDDLDDLYFRSRTNGLNAYRTEWILIGRV